MKSLKRLVLLGGGHSNCMILKYLKNKLPSNLELFLVSEYDYSDYSGMLPATIASTCFEMIVL